MGRKPDPLVAERKAAEKLAKAEAKQKRLDAKQAKIDAKVKKKAEEEEAFRLFCESWQGGNKAWVLRQDRINKTWLRPMPITVGPVFDGMVTVCYPNSDKPYFYKARNVFATYDDALTAYDDRIEGGWQDNMYFHPKGITSDIWSEE
jgi:hypothetical protein